MAALGFHGVSITIIYIYPMKVGLFTLCLFILISCGRVKERSDELYSRHLQRKVQLTVIYTRPPSDKSTLNLLILNDGQDIAKLRVKESLDSLDKGGYILPLVIVAVNAGDRMQEYGVADRPDYEG
ncbi:MAG TPA: hypothetical protein VFV08_04170, partial [Puia sp.]|nr:hypothetical protein [Puia sp.]